MVHMISPLASFGHGTFSPLVIGRHDSYSFFPFRRQRGDQYVLRPTFLCKIVVLRFLLSWIAKRLCSGGVPQLNLPPPFSCYWSTLFPGRKFEPILPAVVRRGLLTLRSRL